MDVLNMSDGLNERSPFEGSRMESIRHGNEAAFNDFYRTYAERLYRYLFTLARGRDDLARDALQEAMLRVVRYARPLPDEAAVWNWLARIGRTALVDLLRKEGRGQERERQFLETVNADLGPSESAMAERLHVILSALLDDLPEEDRRLVEGVYFQGRSQANLARETGTTRKAIESRLARLRQRLRKRLQEMLNHDEAD
ncbi:MAG: sigma-70 family RNA polymerase sigma factor [Verrucomicrobiota bacterium]